MTLTEFLTSRLAEEKAVASACQSPSPWQVSSHPSASSLVDDAAGNPLIYDEGSPSAEEAAHIARHDPARALREVAVMRAILAGLEDEQARRLTLRDSMATEGNRSYAEGFADALGDCLYRLRRQWAAIWSDHPDYDQGWAP